MRGSESPARTFAGLAGITALFDLSVACLSASRTLSSVSGVEKPRRWEKRVPSADMLPVQAEPTAFFRVARRLVVGPLLHGLFRVDVKGRELLPAGQCVVVANHSNWVDGMLILDLMPSQPRVHFLGDPTSVLERRTPKNLRPKSLVRAAGARFTWFMMKHMGGFIPVDRNITGGNMVLREHADNCMKIGGSLGGFPEATYAYRKFEGKDRQLPYKKGLFHFAKDAGVPVAAVVVSGARSVWFRKRIEVNVVGVMDVSTRSVENLADTARLMIGSKFVMEPRQGKPGINRLHLFESRWNPPPRTEPPPSLAVQEPALAAGAKIGWRTETLIAP